MARVLISGGTGFIGAHLAKRCLKRGDAVTLMGHPSDPRPEFLPPSTSVLHTDLRDPSAVRAALAGQPYEVVFNLSGYIDHTPFFSGGRAVLDQHFVGLQNLLECLDRSALRAFVQVGSSDEYGSAPAPQREDLRESPIAPYSLGKMAATHLIQMLHRTESFPGSVVRFFLVYGPGQNLKRFIPQIIRGCLRGESFPASEGRQVRDFSFVEDIVDGLLAAAETPAAQGRVINLASGVPVTIRHVVETLVSLCGGGVPRFGEIAYRPGENMALYADADLARTLLKWSVKTSLEDGLRRTIDSCRPHFVAQKTRA